MYRRLIFLILITASAVSVAQTGTSEFTIAAIPDTQFYSKSYPQILTSETQWIANHATEFNIQVAVGLGDIVDSGGQNYQWQNADLGYRVLDGKLPYLVPIGNHDYDANNPAGRTGSTKNFNAYFGPQRYAGKSWYKGQYPAGSNENFYGVFTFGGRQYLILVLECFPRNAALSWASAVMKNHAGMDTIVVTHAFTYADSTRMDRCDSNSAGSFGVAQDNDGEQVWEKFASKYPNIVMVLSGHVVQGDGTGHRTDLGVNGNVVNEMLSDYQSWPNGGNGYIRLITVRPAQNQVVVRTYSPFLNRWLTDAHNQFAVPYKNMGMQVTFGSIAGKIKNASDCSGVSGAVVADGYGAVTTDANGIYGIPVIGPASYKISVAKTGYMALPQTASMVPSTQAPGKILMARTGVLRGVVMYNGQVVPNSKIVLNGGILRWNTSMIAGASGGFSFGSVPYGTYWISATVPGTTLSTTYKVSVTTGGTTYVKFDIQ